MLSELSLNVVAGAASPWLPSSWCRARAWPSRPRTSTGRSDANRDFMAQGFGNIAAGLFRGQPVGGSVGQTALNVTAGRADALGLDLLGRLDARDPRRVLVGIVGNVAMPTLAAVLIFAGVSSVRLGSIDTVWRTGLASRIAFVGDLRRDAVPLRHRCRGHRHRHLAAAAAEPGGARSHRRGARPASGRALRAAPGAHAAPARAPSRCSTSTEACTTRAPAPSRRGCPIPPARRCPW